MMVKTISDLLTMKQNKEKISMLTAYDYPSAKQVEEAHIDTILVGDSLGMTVLGYDSIRHPSRTPSWINTTKCRYYGL